MRGAIVPHAPLLLEELSSPEVAATGARIRAAIASLDRSDVDVAVVVSPHGERAGVYRGVEGSLDAFGLRGIEGKWEGEASFAGSLAGEWDAGRIEGPVDHGVLVPLLLGAAGDLPVVAVSLTENVPRATGPAFELDRARNEAIALSDALTRALGGKRAYLIASATTSAGSSARAPMTELPGAVARAAELADALAREPERIEATARELARTGASCSYGVFVAWQRLIEGPARVLAAEAPVGVGYLVAEAT